jgi:hypothetical protein
VTDATDACGRQVVGDEFGKAAPRAEACDAQTKEENNNLCEEVLGDEDTNISENRRRPMTRYRLASRGAGAPGQRAGGRSKAGRRECGGGQGSG